MFLNPAKHVVSWYNSCMAHPNLKSPKDPKPPRMVVRTGSKRRIVKVRIARSDSARGAKAHKTKESQLGVTGLIATNKEKEQRLPTQPTAEEIAEGRAVARSLFDPAAAAAARAAFLERQQPSDHAG